MSKSVVSGNVVTIPGVYNVNQLDRTHTYCLVIHLMLQRVVVVEQMDFRGRLHYRGV